MAATPSTMLLSLGARAPAFTLPDPDMAPHRLEDLAGPHGLLVMFISNHCPFVIHVRAGLVRIAAEAQGRGVGVVAIGSNDFEAYPDDAPDRMKADAEAHGFGFPYLVDASQAVAKAYGAACTPDFFLFDGDLRLVYRGRLDASRPGNGVSVTGADLRAALDALLEGRPPLAEQLPSMGCNIKWKPGNEPAYFG